MRISVLFPVYNEEKRVIDALNSLKWCDEIILIDKNSTDRTVELALASNSNVRICYMDNTKAYISEVDVFLANATGDWVLIFTASDVMHPALADQIRKVISDVSFDYDVLHIPYKKYILGVNSKRSPWYSELNPVIIRKSVLYSDKNEVHGAIKYSGKHYKFQPDDVGCIYHLTHETVDIMMDRHLRYWRGEALSENINLKTSFKSVISGIINLTFIRKTFLLGYDGLMLMFAYLSYLMMSYVYKWEKKRSSAPSIYADIKRKINAEWDKAHSCKEG